MTDTNQSPADVAAFLRRYNEWRREGAEEMPEPAEIGKSIDAAVKMLGELKAAMEQEPVAWMYDWQAPEGLIRDWATSNQEEIPKHAVNIRPLYARSVPAEQPVNARLLEALRHILNGSLSLPRFAEEQARAAIAAAEAQQARLVRLGSEQIDGMLIAHGKGDDGFRSFARAIEAATLRANGFKVEN